MNACAPESSWIHCYRPNLKSMFTSYSLAEGNNFHWWSDMIISEHRVNYGSRWYVWMVVPEVKSYDRVKNIWRKSAEY